MFLTTIVLFLMIFSCTATDEFNILNSYQLNGTEHTKIFENLFKIINKHCKQMPSWTCIKKILKFSFNFNNKTINCEELKIVNLQNLPKFFFSFNIENRPIFLESISFLFMFFSHAILISHDDKCAPLVPLRLIYYQIFYNIDKDFLNKTFFEINNTTLHFTAPVTATQFIKYNNIILKHSFLRTCDKNLTTYLTGTINTSYGIVTINESDELFQYFMNVKQAQNISLPDFDVTAINDTDDDIHINNSLLELVPTFNATVFNRSINLYEIQNRTTVGVSNNSFVIQYTPTYAFTYTITPPVKITTPGKKPEVKTRDNSKSFTENINSTEINALNYTTIYDNPIDANITTTKLYTTKTKLPNLLITTETYKSSSTLYVTRSVFQNETASKTKP
ncbi:envelope glycoprotein O [Murid herpesvirus 3]|uniref:Envelope glycoprotein O n=2 Tax=Murid betaherpesvirus 3 TaxID=2560603 RepID=A0A1P8VIU8_9BETA|nr:envelope glycoprotein O [Murine roseolovirus]APZ76276.1 envelope glycoprotein O [Murid betaherpesvirus 3]AYH64744.1 envelope glycoprotein O [Murid herpesvirus 3]